VLLFWILFNVFVAAMLALDLGVLNRRREKVSFRAALAWSGIWVGLAVAFAVILLFWHGRSESLQFTTGYIIELTLSADNLFAFLVIFRYFKVPDQYQHKVLIWGIVGAIVMRGIFIAAGADLLDHFDWITYVFGALLIYSGVKLLRRGDEKPEPERNPVLRAFRRMFPVTEEFDGGRFFTKRDVMYATPLFVVLLIVETTDIVLAIDSVPAVFAITTNAFIVYTSNVFAILGLRSMYFALAGVMDRFHYLHYGLSVVLIFIGVKMLASHYVTLPTEWALGIVLFVLGASIVASLMNPRKIRG
jgi:tellurite resistance protein TerC